MTAEEIAWRVWTAATPSDRALRSALVPAAIAYSAGMAVRNRLYDAGWLAVRRVPARVVSVGSITVGGAGKTPAALWLAERLSARGYRVGIVARGYRKRRRGVVVVGDTGRPLVAPEDGAEYQDLKPLILPRPLMMEMQWTYTAMADRCMLIPGMTRVGPRAVAYKARDAEQGFSLFLACLVLARSIQ